MRFRQDYEKLQQEYLELKQAFQELEEEHQELQERFEFLMAAVEHLPNPVFMKDKDARFFFFNKAYSKFFGMRRRDYVGSTVLDLDYLPQEARERFQEEDLRAIAEENTISYNTSFTTADGREHPSFYWSRGFRDSVNGQPGLVGEIVDISKERMLQDSLDETIGKLREANETLRSVAQTDPASGLYNRLVLWDMGREVLTDSRKEAFTACMIMFDMDGFKRVNDGYDHLMGDDILSRFADILRSECRTTDIPIRYGGDEFLIILRRISLEDAMKVAERIRSRSERELILPDGKTVTSSVGVIEIDGKTDFENNLLRLDRLLYKAKNQGRNRVISE